MGITGPITRGVVGSITGRSPNGAPPVEPDFLFTVETTGAAEAFTIPCQNVGVFDAVIDWGDGGATSVITAFNDADLSHTYAVAGEYQIRISGTLPNIYFNNGGHKLKVISVENLGSVGWLRLNRAFFGCTNLVSFDCGDCDTSNVTQFDYMMRGCVNAATIDVSNLDTSSATQTQEMFTDCAAAVVIDVSGFDMSNVTNANSMFIGCTLVLVLDVSAWVVSLLEDANGMCDSCTSLTTFDVSNWDTPVLADVSYMWFDCAALTGLVLSGWDVTSITTAESMLEGADDALDTEEYDALLVAWEGQAVQNNVTVHFGTTVQYNSGAPATARADLIADHTWTITDGGAISGFANNVIFIS